MTSSIRTKLVPRGASVGVLAATLEDVQKTVRDKVTEVQIPLVDGVSVSAAIGVAATPVTHRLGRQPVGWIITDVETGPAVLTRTAWDASTITLAAVAPTQVTLWVF